jgi:hypothetical protein
MFLPKFYVNGPFTFFARHVKINRHIWDIWKNVGLKTKRNRMLRPLYIPKTNVHVYKDMFSSMTLIFRYVLDMFTYLDISWWHIWMSSLGGQDQALRHWTHCHESGSRSCIDRVLYKLLVTKDMGGLGRHGPAEWIPSETSSRGMLDGLIDPSRLELESALGLKGWHWAQLAWV